MKIQAVLPGLEDYVCTSDCLNCKLCPGICSPPDLSACPYPQCLCPANDWGLVDKIEYPEFFWWRFEQIFGGSDEFLVITPDMMDEYFKEPEDSMQTRCPRCLSVEVDIGYPYIKCKNCGYNEPLIDFPENVGFQIHKQIKKEEI